MLAVQVQQQVETTFNAALAQVGIEYRIANGQRRPKSITAGFSVSEAQAIGALVDNIGYYTWTLGDSDDITTFKHYILYHKFNYGR